MSDSHKVRAVTVNDGTERQPAFPRRRHVADADITVSFTLPLAPQLQSSHLGSHRPSYLSTQSTSVFVLEESSCLRESSRTHLLIYKSLSSDHKSSKIIKDYAFCKQFIMDDHVKSINSVTATTHDDTVKNVLLTDVRYYLLIDVSK